MTATHTLLSTASLAKAAGVGRETLRFYEEQGLIAPRSRSAAGYRQFDKHTVDLIAFIKQTQLAGFSLKEIKRLLGLRANGQDTCGAMSKVLADKLKETDTELAALQARREALRALTNTCEQQDATRACGFVRQGPGCC